MQTVARAGAGAIGALVLGLVLAACAQSEPGEAIHAYLSALMAQDEDELYKTICQDWEAQAAVDLGAFSEVTGRLEGVTCRKIGSEGRVALVTCAGKMVLDYNGEERERSLANTTYLAEEVDGTWRMCGYR